MAINTKYDALHADSICTWPVAISDAKQYSLFHMLVRRLIEDEPVYNYSVIGHSARSSAEEQFAGAWVRTYRTQL